MTPPFDLDEIRAAAATLRNSILHTPTVNLHQTGLGERLPDGCNATLKLELFQKTGSFKARGNLLSLMALTTEQLGCGVVAASGGNHALALSWAARTLGVRATIAIPKTADPVRLNGCRAFGADLVLCDTIGDAFDTMHRIAETENRAIIHPFEGRAMSLGAATCALEMHAANPDMEIAILPVGGGGLISGMSAALKLLNPDIEIYGIEPFGADTMYRSFQAGTPQSIEKVDTIADSLGSPTALPFSFDLARANVTAIKRVSDDALRDTMRLLNHTLKLMVEPACAASLAGALGPLADTCRGRNIALLACGANIGPERFTALTA
jgi:threonine dehydratase